MIPRREFLSLLPPALPVIKQVLRSPKDQSSPNKPMRRPRPMSKAGIKLATVPGLSITGIEVQDGFVTLTWEGGRDPFNIETKIDNGPWTKVGSSIIGHTATFPIQGDHALIRIVDNITQVLTATNVDGHARLSWEAPIITS